MKKLLTIYKSQFTFEETKDDVIVTVNLIPDTNIKTKISKISIKKTSEYGDEVIDMMVKQLITSIVEELRLYMVGKGEDVESVEYDETVLDDLKTIFNKVINE